MECGKRRAGNILLQLAADARIEPILQVVKIIVVVVLERMTVHSRIGSQSQLPNVMGILHSRLSVLHRIALGLFLADDDCLCSA